MNNNGKTFPVLALTATATKKTEMSLRETLNIAPENALRNDAIRDNLSLSVIRCVVFRETNAFTLLAKRSSERSGNSVRCVQKRSRISCELLEGSGRGRSSLSRGLDKSERHRTQMQFQENKVRVIVAAVAFGMGLDMTGRSICDKLRVAEVAGSVHSTVRQSRSRRKRSALTFWIRRLFTVAVVGLAGANVMARAFEISWKLYFRQRRRSETEDDAEKEEKQVSEEAFRTRTTILRKGRRITTLTVIGYRSSGDKTGCHRTSY